MRLSCAWIISKCLSAAGRGALGVELARTAPGRASLDRPAWRVAGRSVGLWRLDAVGGSSRWVGYILSGTWNLAPTYLWLSGTLLAPFCCRGATGGGGSFVAAILFNRYCGISAGSKPICFTRINTARIWASAVVTCAVSHLQSYADLCWSDQWAMIDVERQLETPLSHKNDGSW